MMVTTEGVSVGGTAERMAGGAIRAGVQSVVLNGAVVARKCEWGVSCLFGAMCLAWHSFEEQEHFAMKQALKRREWGERCAFCVRGCCRHGEMCRRGIGGRNASWDMKREIETGARKGAEREQESDYESAEEEPPAERTKGVGRGPSVEESWSEDWGEEVMAGEVPLQRLGADWQVSGGSYSALSSDDEEEFDGGEEEELVFRVRAQARACGEKGGRVTKQAQDSEHKKHDERQPSGAQDQHQGGAGMKFEPVVGQEEIQSWARRLAGADEQEVEQSGAGAEVAQKADDKDERRRAARRERRMRMWEKDPVDWWHTEWARAEVVERLAGCMVGAGEIVRCKALLQGWKRGGQEGQQAVRKRRKPAVEEKKEGGEMRHKPG